MSDGNDGTTTAYTYMTSKGSAYPSISSVEGSATRNREPILAALGPWIASADHPSILEIASGTGEHAVGYAEAFPDASFLVTERDEAGLSTLRDAVSAHGPLRGPVKLDVFDEADWQGLRRATEAPSTGIIINNLVHCAPPETPEAIFSHIQPGSQFVAAGAWVVIYGAFLQDDGTFASDGDRAFDARFRGLHESFGLRTVPSLAKVAKRHGYYLTRQQPMPAGNWFLVFEQKE